jgi:hypothetical protein
LQWTTKSTRNLADALTAAGHQVSRMRVSELLHEQHYSLQGNAKGPSRNNLYGLGVWALRWLLLGWIV